MSEEKRPRHIEGEHIHISGFKNGMNLSNCSGNLKNVTLRGGGSHGTGFTFDGGAEPAPPAPKPSAAKAGAASVAAAVTAAAIAKAMGLN